MQDRRLLRSRGEAYRRWIDETSAVPFAAIAAGRQRLVVAELPVAAMVAGVGVGVALRAFHGSLMADRGAWFVGVVVAGSVVLGGSALRRARADTAGERRGNGRETGGGAGGGSGLIGHHRMVRGTGSGFGWGEGVGHRGFERAGVGVGVGGLEQVACAEVVEDLAVVVGLVLVGAAHDVPGAELLGVDEARGGEDLVEGLRGLLWKL